MHRNHSLLALVVVLLSPCLNFFSSAHSTHAPLLKRATNPRTISVEILPRQDNAVDFSNLNKRAPSPHPDTLRYDDSFRLTISAFDETFHLHLRPTEDLVHPAARIKYYTLNSDGNPTLDRTEPLLRESVKAYSGHVIAPSYTAQRLQEDIVGVVPRPHPGQLGWARISVHHQGDTTQQLPPLYEGAFSASGVIYYISTKDNYLRNKQPLDPDVSRPLGDADDLLVIWRDSDQMTSEEEHLAKTGSRSAAPTSPPRTCGHDSLPYNTEPYLNSFLRPSTSWLDELLNAHHVNGSTLYGRDDAPGTGMSTDFSQFIGQTAGCPTDQKVVYMGVAADCEYVAKYNGQENAKTAILTNWNIASVLYKDTFNVSLAITELNVQAPSCPAVTDPNLPWNVPCSASVINDRLSRFSQWRGTKSNDTNGLWHLMSGCPTGTEVGIAWLATLCQRTSGGTPGQIVSGTAVSTSGRTEWQVIAHEIGHNFGAIHDCADGCTTGTTQCCPLTSNTCNADGRFIMSPVAQSGEKIFSPCTLGNVCAVMRGVQGSKVETSCLVDPDPNRVTISLQMCGNGIVEAGEDCDPGGTDSACCDAKTCKFKSGAVCDPRSSTCCTDQCSFAPTTQVCRPSKDSRCDTQEFCTGNSSSCPRDVVAPNGQDCGNGLQCASGQCTSIGQQCQMVGSSMNLTKACPDRSDRSCQISCQDPTNANACIRLTSLVIDGSPCGYGGTCSSGKCQSGGFMDTVKAWYTSNLQIAIPVTIVAGLVLLLVIWGIISAIRRCFTRSSARKIANRPLSLKATHQRLGSQGPAGAYQGPYRNVPPTARSGYTRMPPEAAHDRSRSGQDMQGFNYAANNRTSWVDDRLYNGQR